jgi:DNA-binding transcriptional MerR regulator
MFPIKKEAQMLSIGEFSKICMCTTKTLRHYDRIGLLKPACYNAENGYRYYESKQLFDMLLIQKLKSYGFSLKEIKKLIPGKQKELLESLEKKYALHTAHLEKQKALLEKMKTDMETLRKGKDIMQTQPLEIKIVRQPDVNIISIRENICIRDFEHLFSKVYDLMQQTGAACLGAPFAIYHSPEFDPEDTDVEVGFPTETTDSHTRILKGGDCAVALHKGPYSNLTEVYARLVEWLEAGGLTPAAPPYEKYLNSPQEVPEDQLLTEVCFPIHKH